MAFPEPEEGVTVSQLGWPVMVQDVLELIWMESLPAAAVSLSVVLSIVNEGGVSVFLQEYVTTKKLKRKNDNAFVQCILLVFAARWHTSKSTTIT